MNKNQKGFAVLEGLLILIVIIVIGGIGWYALHTKHQTDKILSQADKISQSTPVKTQSSTTESTQKYLIIKEWGVRLPYNGGDSLSYQPIAGTNIIDIVSKNLSDKYECTASGGGEIRRMLPDEDPTPGQLGETTAAKDAAANPGFYGRAGNYYFEFMHDQAACSQTVTASAQNEVNNFVSSLVPKIRAI